MHCTVTIQYKNTLWQVTIIYFGLPFKKKRKSLCIGRVQQEIIWQSNVCSSLWREYTSCFYYRLGARTGKGVKELLSATCLLAFE